MNMDTTKIRLEMGKKMRYHDKYYKHMDMNDFSIFRPPTTRRYIKARDKLMKIEQQEIDKRWNLYHNTFKRNFFYRILKPLVRLLRKRGVL